MTAHELEPQNPVLRSPAEIRPQRPLESFSAPSAALLLLAAAIRVIFRRCVRGIPRFGSRGSPLVESAPDRVIEIVAVNVRSGPARVRPQSPQLRDLLSAGSVGARTGKRGRKCSVDAEGHGRRNEGRRRFGRAAGKESLGFSCPPQRRIKERLRLADQCATDCVGNSGMRASADGEVSGSRFSILPGPLPARSEFSRRAESTAPSCGHRRGIPPRSSPNGCTLRIRALHTASRTWPSTWRASPRFQRRR